MSLHARRNPDESRDDNGIIESPRTVAQGLAGEDLSLLSLYRNEIRGCLEDSRLDG